MSEKIKPHHLERKAILYIFQSSAACSETVRFGRSGESVGPPSVDSDAALAPEVQNLFTLAAT